MHAGKARAHDVGQATHYRTRFPHGHAVSMSGEPLADVGKDLELARWKKESK